MGPARWLLRAERARRVGHHAGLSTNRSAISPIRIRYLDGGAPRRHSSQGALEHSDHTQETRDRSNSRAVRCSARRRYSGEPSPMNAEHTTRLKMVGMASLLVVSSLVACKRE